MQVPQAAPAPGREQRSVTILREVGQFLTGLFIRDYGADRQTQFDILTTRTIAIRTAAGLAVRRPVDTCVAVIDQRVDIAVGARPNAAASATVTVQGTGPGCIGAVHGVVGAVGLATVPVTQLQR